MPNRHHTTTEWIAACDSNLAEKSLSFAALPGGEVHEGNPRWFVTGSNLAGYNGIVQAVFPADQVDGGVEAALAPFRARNLPLTWWTGPSTQPGNLGMRLQAHGFRHNRDMIGMAAPIEALASPFEHLPEIAFEQVLDTQTLLEWLPLYSAGFGAPPDVATESLRKLGELSFRPDSRWFHFLCRKEGRIITISSLFVNDEIAGLYNLVTDPQERSQGVGAAMTLQTFDWARQCGYRIATLQTTYPNALRLYHRLGFEVYCKFGIYQFLIE
ncbi:MAG: GNAT family N-acetyltransferase [Anaerolineaceae bacterium]|nr:GNAT family N-acetyltransferase [Anaerolineaceae bacterium]